jgi:UDP-glucose 4-epimerase
MSVAVIGGAGFIGSHLVDELMTQGFEVAVLDNLSEGKLENIERWRGHPKLEFIRGDIRDRELVRRFCDHRDWVFHLAAMSRIQPSITDPHLAFEENVMGTINVLEGCRLGGVKRFVYSGSSSVYGRGAMAESLIKDGSGVHEGLSPDFLSPYALSKHFGEDAAELYLKLYGLSTVSLRYFNVYGPRHQETGSYATVIAIFRKQKREGQPLTIVGDGKQRRDFTFVSDVVRANMLAAMNFSAHGTFNIGAGKNYSINEVAEIVAPGHPTVNIPERQGEARLTLSNTVRARDELGWKPLIDFRQGLEVTDLFERNKYGLITLVG